VDNLKKIFELKKPACLKAGGLFYSHFAKKYKVAMKIPAIKPPVTIIAKKNKASVPLISVEN